MGPCHPKEWHQKTSHGFLVPSRHTLLQDMINADELLAEKKFASCDGTCQRAMSSVMDANLLLFKTVIAGDSWGEIPDER